MATASDLHVLCHYLLKSKTVNISMLLFFQILLFQVHYIRNEDILELHCSYSLSVILLSVTNSEKLPSNCFHYIYECHKQMFELSVPKYMTICIISSMWFPFTCTPLMKQGQVQTQRSVINNYSTPESLSCHSECI